MEALDALAVAEQDILARTTAPRRTRENRACSGDNGLRPRARLALPVRQGRCLWNRPPSVPRRDGLCDRLPPGGLKGRGALAATSGSPVASVTPIRAGGAESADMSLSDRQRPEGFHRTTSSTVLSSKRASSLHRTRQRPLHAHPEAIRSQLCETRRFVDHFACASRAYSRVELVWTDAKQDAARFRTATVEWRRPDGDQRAVDAWRLLA